MDKSSWPSTFQQSLAAGGLEFRATKWLDLGGPGALTSGKVGEPPPSLTQVML